MEKHLFLVFLQDSCSVKCSKIFRKTPVIMFFLGKAHVLGLEFGQKGHLVDASLEILGNLS